MKCKQLKAILFEKKYHVKYNKTPVYYVCESQQKFGVCYCVNYKPEGSLEWILARGWWNDAGIWTANGIFNDGII